MVIHDFKCRRWFSITCKQLGLFRSPNCFATQNSSITYKPFIIFNLSIPYNMIFSLYYLSNKSIYCLSINVNKRLFFFFDFPEKITDVIVTMISPTLFSNMVQVNRTTGISVSMSGSQYTSLT